MSSYTDQHLTCADCGHDFVRGAKEHEFFHEKGFQVPRRCNDCRQAQKERRGGGGRKGGGE